jgi:hypothetical protein
MMDAATAIMIAVFAFIPFSFDIRVCRIGFMIAGPQPAVVDRLAVPRPCFASGWSEIGVSAMKTV